MKKFVEKKSVKVIDKITIACAFVSVLSFLSLFWINVTTLFVPLFIVLISFIVAVGILGMVRFFLSNKDKYTREFLKYMQSRIDNAKTSDEMQDVFDEFINLSTENGKFFNLSFPTDLKIMNNDIISQLKALKNKPKFNDEEEVLIIDSLNHYWHYSNTELQRNDLGDIERKNLEGIRTKCKDILNELHTN